jgi:hypothetical protein
MKLKTVESFITVARAIADVEFDSDFQFRHVSLIIKNKSIVGVGTNVRKTHTFNERNGYKEAYLHSEAAAYANIKYKNGPFVLLNFRFNKNGELRNSRPCKYCYAFCVNIFDEIWYSTDNGMVKL